MNVNASADRVLSRAKETHFEVGRAGMLYRDLIPGRCGGRFIASNIRIEGGGPVPDYVHFHEVRFQLIYCSKGWIRVVYEDQGPSFVMHAGDGVLQPPRIRHRVLECSPGAEVVEIAGPAEYVTQADPSLTLPTTHVDAERDFSGQRFVFHQAASARHQPWRVRGFEARDLGIAAATRGLASARVARATDTSTPGSIQHDGELLFLYVLSGEVALEPDERLVEGDAVVLPPGPAFQLRATADDTQLLEITLPA